ncbi:hypothetical protein WL1483_3557 [Aeromonas schubertii]|uniref:Uncharacterized protein n=1 Tax=Aeromonas schubertii TaxID=652 RepID=A0A0S2SMK5_9GAMM|nr:hypothetical protein WL1483_3557 [Aeromonas schubertii]
MERLMELSSIWGDVFNIVLIDHPQGNWSQERSYSIDVEHIFGVIR